MQGGGGGEREGQNGEEPEQSGAFQYVTRINHKKKNKKNRRPGKGAIVQQQQEEVENSETRLARRIQIITTKKAYLCEGSIGKQINALLDAALPSNSKNDKLPKSILTLGLGNVKSSRSSQMQLAFLLVVRDRLMKLLPTEEEKKEKEENEEKREANIEIEAYDPVFDEEDCHLLEHFQIDTSAKNGNVQGKYHLDRPTFVYLPHCPKGLYENLLRSNWSLQGLQRLWLCCNDLERYHHSPSSTTSSPSCSSKSLINRIVPFLRVHHLPSLPSPHNDALNDLAIQRFDPEKHKHSNPVDHLARQLSSVKLKQNPCNKNNNDTPFESGEAFWHISDAGDDDLLKDPELQ